MNFWDIYALSYDLLNKLYPYQELQDRAVANLQLIPHLKILDAGCGTGNTITRITLLNPKPWNIQIVGVDISTPMLRRAQKKLASIGGINLIKGNFDVALKKNKGGFDRIVSVNSFYTAEDPERTVHTWYELLEDGGIVVIANPFRPNLWWIFKDHFITAWRKKDFLGFFDFLLLLPGWLFLIAANLIIKRCAKRNIFRFLDPEKVKTLFLKAGFEVLSQEILYGGTVTLFSFQKDLKREVRRAQTPKEIEEALQLRFRVYCHEIKSLDPKDYPNCQEFDRFDPYAIHFLARSQSKLNGCIRLLPDHGDGFLLEEEFPLPPQLARQRNITLEVSRWIVDQPKRGTGLWYSLIEEATKWSQKRGYSFWIMAAQSKLWDGLEKRGWNINLWKNYQEYHHTLSAPGNFNPT